MHLTKRKTPTLVAFAIVGALWCETIGSNAIAEEPFRPSTIDFDMTLESTRTSLKSLCTLVEERRIEPPEIPDTQDNHTQIDCHGFVFQGKERLAEFAFRDGHLILVWILTEKAEEASLEKAMRAAFGAPSHQSASFTAFASRQSALRKDKAEVLFYADTVAPMFAAWFDQSAKSEGQ